MAQLRVAVSLGNLPQMLRSIILETLESAPNVGVLSSGLEAEAGRLDAHIVSGHDAPEEYLRLANVRRLIDVEPEGRHATVHWLGHETRRIDDLSPERLLSLVTEEPLSGSTAAEQVRHGILCRTYQQLFKVRASAKPQPLIPESQADVQAVPHDEITRELAQLAMRILRSRGEKARQEGPSSELTALARRLAEYSSDHRPGALPGLERVATLFHLTEDERNLLFFSAVVEIDPRAARLVALLNDHMRRPWPTVGLVADLGGEPRLLAERLVAESPLTRFDLVSLEGVGPVSAQAVIVKPEVWPLLFGMQRRAPYPVEPLGEYDLGRLALPDNMRPVIGRAADFVTRKGDARLLAVVAGDAGVGRREIAKAIAARLQRRTILVSGEALENEEVIGTVAREATLAEAAVILTRPDALSKGVWRALTERLVSPLFAVTERAKVGALALAAARPVIEIQAPHRDRAQRLRMWMASAPVGWSRGALEEIAERFDFGRDHIASALSLARARAEADDRAPPEPHDAKAACETLRDTRFEGAAERLDCPFAPSDIVLRPETRRELDLTVAWASHGARLFCKGGPGEALHAGGGLACLFSGPPGTGKTMAAQIIARQIDYALFRIDLSQVIDKFIGESEKRLSTLFDEAERSRVALFFDEADALFGKRTEVHDSHDRYANITVDHLLQKLEGFGGLAILATNIAGNIDDAFLRRVRIRAEFPAPDATDRRRIWEKLLPVDKARGEDIDVARLADTFELVGGEIRNAVYTAHLLAAVDNHETLAMRHCVAGLWRELSKTGRISDPSDLGPWRSVVVT